MSHATKDAPTEVGADNSTLQLNCGAWKDETEQLIGLAIKHGSRDVAERLTNLPTEYLDPRLNPIRDAIKYQLQNTNNGDYELTRRTFVQLLQPKVERREISIHEAHSYGAVYDSCKTKGERNKPCDAPVLFDTIAAKVKKQIGSQKILEAQRLLNEGKSMIEDSGRANPKAVKVLQNAVSKTVGKGETEVRLQSFSTIKPEPIQWLWDRRIPIGKVTLFAGEGACNKSTVAYDLAARVSAGLNAPLTTDPMKHGKVLIVAGDDDPNNDIRPRLDVMGADVSRVFMLDIREQTADGMKPKAFDLADVASLRSALKSDAEINLVIIDPVSAFVGKRDANKHSDVYALMTPLSQLAAEYQVAVLIVAHTNKGGRGDNSFRGRVNGSSAWTDACRSGFMFVKDRRHEDRRIMAHGKMNAARISKGISFSVVECPHAEAVSAIRIDWEGEVELTADQALQQAADGDAEKLNEAVEFLKGQQGWVSTKQLFSEAEKAGIAERTLWRAKAKLKIEPKRRGFGRGGESGWQCGATETDQTGDREDKPF